MIPHDLSCFFFDFLDINRAQKRRLCLHIDIGHELGPFVGKRRWSCHTGHLLPTVVNCYHNIPSKDVIPESKIAVRR